MVAEKSNISENILDISGIFRTILGIRNAQHNVKFVININSVKNLGVLVKNVIGGFWEFVIIIYSLMRF